MKDFLKYWKMEGGGGYSCISPGWKWWQLVSKIEIETLFIRWIKMTWFWGGKLHGYMIFALKIQLEFVTMFKLKKDKLIHWQIV